MTTKRCTVAPKIIWLENLKLSKRATSLIESKARWIGLPVIIENHAILKNIVALATVCILCMYVLSKIWYTTFMKKCTKLSPVEHHI